MNALPDSVSTARLRLLIEHSADGIGLLAADGTILYASPPSRRLLGYAPEELSGHSALAWLHPQELARGTRLLGRLVKKPGPPRAVPFRWRHKDGSWRWLEVIASNLLGEPAVQALLVNYRDVTARRRAAQTREQRLALVQTHLLEQVQAGRARAQLLSQRLLEAQEAERRRLARELHDEIGQILTAVKLNLQAVRGLARQPAALPPLDESLAVVDRALRQVRSLSLDLRPSLLDDLGLVAALRWYLDRQAQRAGFAAEFAADPADLRAAPNVETACFRVAQEALTNVVRHARARRVKVELGRHGAELHLAVRDDGSGFDVAAARRLATRGTSLGLLGMEERVLLMGGEVSIQSAPGHGTEIRARLPLAALPSLERRKKKREVP